MGDGESMRDENNLYWIWLAERFGVASKDFPTFADKFDDPYDVYRMTEEEIGQIEGISDRLKERLGDKSILEAYDILKYCKKHQIDIIGYGDARYPARLKTIEDPPVLLYCQGRLPALNSMLCFGMVGTRKMSEYGKQTAYKISYELSAANVCIISGMALGIDGVCACGALNGGGVTVAVLGCGLATVYPREHERLMKAIAKRGAVITEYPPFEKPHGYNFPKRNRIISGLCQGVAVIEGAHGSGALITASRAISQGRELFALPGKINESNSDGPNELIRSGANVMLCADDIINHYDFLYHDVINYRGFSNAKKRSDLREDALRAYGVSSVYDRERYVTKGAKADGVAVSKPEASLNSVKEKTENKQCRDQSASGDSDKEKMIAALDSGTQKIYDLLPEGSFNPDAVTSKGVGAGELMTALTMLEISGLITSLPGGMYKKT